MNESFFCLQLVWVFFLIYERRSYEGPENQQIQQKLWKKGKNSNKLNYQTSLEEKFLRNSIEGGILLDPTSEFTVYLWQSCMLLYFTYQVFFNIFILLVSQLCFILQIGQWSLTPPAFAIATGRINCKCQFFFFFFFFFLFSLHSFFLLATWIAKFSMRVCPTIYIVHAKKLSFRLRDLMNDLKFSQIPLIVQIIQEVFEYINYKLL